MKPKYSGEESRHFWNEVNRLARRNPTGHRECFSLGCALQDLEHRVLHALSRARAEIAAKHKRRSMIRGVETEPGE